MKVVRIERIRFLLRWLLIIFYFFAGWNHFIHPEFYVPLIPDYFSEPELINWISGGLEVLLAIGVAISKYRKIAVVLIILMLIAFIPSHVFFIQEGACMNDQSLCTPMWVAWLRLLIIHPLFILWAWFVGKR